MIDDTLTQVDLTKSLNQQNQYMEEELRIKDNYKLTAELHQLSKDMNERLKLIEERQQQILDLLVEQKEK